MSATPSFANRGTVRWSNQLHPASTNRSPNPSPNIPSYNELSADRLSNQRPNTSHIGSADRSSNQRPNTSHIGSADRSSNQRPNTSYVGKSAYCPTIRGTKRSIESSSDQSPHLGSKCQPAQAQSPHTKRSRLHKTPGTPVSSLLTPVVSNLSLPADDTTGSKYLKRAVSFLHEDDDKSSKKSAKKPKQWYLKDYQRRVLGIDHSMSKSDNIGKLSEDNACNIDTVLVAASETRTVEENNTTIQAQPDHATIIAKNQASIERANKISNMEAKNLGLPTPAELMSEGFGQPSQNHSFTQKGAGETILFLLLKYGAVFLSKESLASFLATHPLVEHMYKMISALRRVDFSKLQEYDPDYATQTEIPQERIKMFMACLFHYDLSVANVMRYANDNYTGAYRDIQASIDKMRGKVDDDLLELYAQVMLFGAPSHFVAESTRENFLLHWRNGNHPSILQDLEKTIKAMNKLEQHQFVMPLHSWIARFIPHLFLTPHHILKKPGKKDRLICDSSRRFTPKSVPINMMTSTRQGAELKCDNGRVLVRILIRIWNLRITYPLRDIILHANDVKSCFRQLKHHPDVMGAFSYIIAGVLYLSCGLTMGSDFSPGVWEICRRLAEQLATSLFDEESLVIKHRAHLDQLQWSKKLGRGKPEEFIPAHACQVYKGVLNSDGVPVNTPHHFFVDDDIYAEVFDKGRIERCIAAGIESLFIILGDSNLAVRQDPIAWDKLYEMVIHYINKVLGFFIDTRKMTIETPQEFVAKVAKLLSTTWGSHRKSFTVKEAEAPTGLLAFIANTAPWLRHLMSHLYTSVAYALGSNTSYLICTNKSFREQIKIAKGQVVESDEMEKSFAQAEMARKVHNLKREHFINDTLREELDIIRAALTSAYISKSIPIAHLIPDRDDGETHGDSSLDSAGGWSIDMKFWWWIDWPQSVKDRTIRVLKDGQSGKLIDINALKYATIIFGYAASIHYWITQGNCARKNIPYPLVRIKADNISSESWTMKGCKRSLVGRRLGRLQCSLMINNPVGLAADRVDTKTNVIADRISRWKKDTDTLLGFETLSQEFPQLKCCRRFHPSQDLISWVLDAMLLEKHADPTTLSQILQKIQDGLLPKVLLRGRALRADPAHDPPLPQQFSARLLRHQPDSRRQYPGTESQVLHHSRLCLGRSEPLHRSQAARSFQAQDPPNQLSCHYYQSFV